MRRWSRIVGLVLGAILLLLGLGVGAVLYPWVRDDLLLDQIVVAVALDWRDFGHDAAVGRLQYELDRRQIGLQVSDEHCALSTTSAGIRVVRCRWFPPIPGYLAENGLTWAFESSASIDSNGELLLGVPQSSPEAAPPL